MHCIREKTLTHCKQNMGRVQRSKLTVVADCKADKIHYWRFFYSNKLGLLSLRLTNIPPCVWPIVGIARFTILTMFESLELRSLSVSKLRLTSLAVNSRKSAEKYRRLTTAVYRITPRTSRDRKRQHKTQQRSYIEGNQFTQRKSFNAREMRSEGGHAANNRDEPGRLGTRRLA